MRIRKYLILTPSNCTDKNPSRSDSFPPGLTVPEGSEYLLGLESVSGSKGVRVWVELSFFFKSCVELDLMLDLSSWTLVWVGIGVWVEFGIEF
eukprot:681086-Amorphochlora_amoeboformis.AAC.1